MSQFSKEVHDPKYYLKKWREDRRAARRSLKKTPLPPKGKGPESSAGHSKLGHAFRAE